MPTIRSVSVSVAALVVMGGLSTAHAATLATVPMQGGMVMPMIAYHADHGHLHVMMPSDVPQLTPVLVSHPSDRFDPADPWFDSLDPTRQGLSFSRRYGFVMDSMSDPLPAGTGIWLRKVSASPELGFYRYSGSAPKRWEPIFGTAGSPDALFWNGDMFHPGVTAPAGSTPLEATFEAVLVETATNTEVPHSGTGPIVLRFTNVSDGRPVVTLERKIVVSWPADSSGWILEVADTIPATQWTPVSHTPVMVDGKPVVILDGTAAQKNFRLRRSP